MATAGSIVVDLLMRTGSFETDAKRASKRLEQMSKQAEKYAKRFVTVSTVVSTAFITMLKSASNYMADIGTAAERTSVSTEAFSELAYAAERASLSQGELQRILRRSTEAINHGIEGTSKQAEALQKLGVSAYDASGKVKTADQMLKSLAERFSKLEPGAEKTKLAIELFGSQLGQKVIPFLNQGAQGMEELAREARKLGLVVDQEAARAANEFNDNLGRLNDTIKGMMLTWSKEVLPVANDYLRFLTEGTKETNNLHNSIDQLSGDTALEEFLRVAALGFAAAVDVAIALAKAVGVVSLAFQAAWADIQLIWEATSFARNPFRFFSDDAKKEFDAAVDHSTNAALAFNAAIKDLWNYQGDASFQAMKKSLERRDFEKAFVGPKPQSRNFNSLPGSSDGDDDKPTKPTGGRSGIDEGQRLIAQMTERIALIGKETEYEKLLARIRAGSITFATDAEREYALALAQTHDVMSQAEKDAAAFKDLMRTLYPEQAKAQEYEENVRLLGAAFEAGAISGQAFADALERVESLAGDGDFWDQYLQGLETAIQSFDELAGNTLENFTKGFGDAFTSMIMDAEDFRTAMYNLANGMARSIIGALGQMAAQWLVYQGVQMLVGKTTQAAAAGTLTANATAQSLQAGLAAYASTAAIPVVGPAAAPAAMASALAATSPMVSAIGAAALSGMAHDGIDSIPKTGSWYLEKGERVTTAKTSARLDALLDKIASGSHQSTTTGKQTNVTVQMQITAPDADSFRKSRHQLEREMALAAQRALARA